MGSGINYNGQDQTAKYSTYSSAKILNDLMYPEKECRSTSYGTEQLRKLIAR